MIHSMPAKEPRRAATSDPVNADRQTVRLLSADTVL